MNEVSHHAMTMALEFLRGDATVTVDGLISTAEKIRDFLTGDAPKASTRGRKKADGAPENGVASEPSTPSEKPALVVDEPAAEPAPVDEKPAAPAEATQDDKDALLKEATTFSQKHGHEALVDALKAVGADKFSQIPFDKYPAFRAAMAKVGDAASALS